MISIIIPTFNRCDSLQETLESLCRQDYAILKEEVEVIVINNNSNDRTPEIVALVAAKAPITMRHIFEPRQGISSARNRGILESRGEFVLFADDDVIVQLGWIQAYQTIFKDYGADCGSGKIVPLWGKQPEPWMLEPALKDTLGGVFALLDHGDKTKVFEQMDMNFFYGANMAFRKSALRELGGFREDMGLVGTKRLYGEDTEMAMRFFKGGKKMVYTPDAVVHHKVPANRLSLAYVRKWRFDKALDSPPAENGKLPPVWLLKECAGNALSILYAYCSAKKTVAIAKEMQFWTQLGQIIGILKR